MVPTAPLSEYEKPLVGLTARLKLPGGDATLIRMSVDGASAVPTIAPRYCLATNSLAMPARTHPAGSTMSRWLFYPAMLLFALVLTLGLAVAQDSTAAYSPVSASPGSRDRSTRVSVVHAPDRQFLRLLCPTPDEPTYGVIDPCQPPSHSLAIRTSRALRSAATNDP